MTAAAGFLPPTGGDVEPLLLPFLQTLEALETKQKPERHNTEEIDMDFCMYSVCW